MESFYKDFLENVPDRLSFRVARKASFLQISTRNNVKTSPVHPISNRNFCM